MEIQSKSLKSLLKKEDAYQVNVGEIIVEISYAKNDISFKECMINILNRKLKGNI